MADEGLEGLHRVKTTRDEAALERSEDNSDNYGIHKPMGTIATIYQLITETPELTWGYLAVFLGCSLSGELVVSSGLVSLSELIHRPPNHEGPMANTFCSRPLSWASRPNGLHGGSLVFGWSQRHKSC